MRTNKKLISLFIIAYFFVQIGLIARAYFNDSTKGEFQTLPQQTNYHFGYQMYHEWSTYTFELFGTLKNGSTIPITQWNDMVNTPRIQKPSSGTFEYANRGMAITMRRIKGALDYVIDHIPEDQETVRISARVTYFYNLKPPARVEVIHSKTRDINEPVE